MHSFTPPCDVQSLEQINSFSLEIKLSTSFLIPKQKKALVVICYTNHALDHFLESLIGFTEKIIRIGSRSKNNKLDKYNLSGMKRSLTETSSRDKRIYKAVMVLNQRLKQSK